MLGKFRPRTRVFALVGILGLFSLPALPEPVHEVMLHPAISFSCAAVVPSQLCRFFLFRYSAGRTTGTQKSILHRDMPSVLKGAGLFIIFLHVQAALVQLWSSSAADDTSYERKRSCNPPYARLLCISKCGVYIYTSGVDIRGSGPLKTYALCAH